MEGTRGNSIGKSVPEGMLTTNSFATRVGVSRDTIVRWRELKVLEPVDSIKHGQTEVYLYSTDQVEIGKMLASGSERSLTDRLKFES